eukprot:1032711_1
MSTMETQNLQMRFRVWIPLKMVLSFCLLFALSQSTEWISPNSSLPNAGHNMIIGEYNQTISLLGGYPTTTSFITYDINANNFSLSNISGLTLSLQQSYSQYYTSINHTIYIAQQDYLSIYNMKTRTFITQWQSLPISYNHPPCLASTDDRLFVSGGIHDGQYLVNFRSFNLQSTQWTNLPSLNTKRAHHACAVHQSTNKSYVFGGFNGRYLCSIERISIDNIGSNSWYEVRSANTYVRGQRAVIHNDDIFIIGGQSYSGSYSSYPYIVFKMNTRTDQLSYSHDTGSFTNLVYGAVNMAVISVENTIYAFGGLNYDRGMYLDSWMYYKFPDPTVSPSKRPTSSPITHEPTLSPTGSVWQSPISPLLPFPIRNFIIGAMNDSIKLIGANNKVITYDISANNFSIDTINGWDEALKYPIAGQYYTSRNDLIYIAQITNLRIYSMEKNEFIASVAYTGYWIAAPCLASTFDTLFLIGGGRYIDQYHTGALDEVRSMDLQTLSWNANLAPLNTARDNGACIAAESVHKLYAIGGGNNLYLSSIERIYIDENSGNHEWDIIGDLDIKLYGQRAVLSHHQDIIFVIGGSGASYYCSDTLNIIDIRNDEISVSQNQNQNLVYPVRSTAAIIVNHTIYAFGGSNGDYALTPMDTWMYYQIPLNPTRTPTKIPSKAPTDNTPNPTELPSQSPITSDPTARHQMNTTTVVRPFCNDIIVEIINLDGISAYDFKRSQDLQDFITDTTSKGIKRSAGEYGIDINTQFMTEVVDVSDQINITEAICTETQKVLNGINLVMDDATDSIAQYIRNQTIRYCMGVSDVYTDNMTVHVYWQHMVNERNKSNGDELEIMSVPSLFITLSIFGLFVSVTVMAVFDAKCWHKTDYLRFMDIIAVSFEVSDIILDVLFAVLLVYTYLYYREIDVLVATVAAFVFIITPLSFSLFQLIQEQKQVWFHDEHLSGWLLDHSKKLLLLSVVCGSSYAAIEIVNCGAFGWQIFNMGLNKQQRIKYNTKRLIGVVLMENCPQAIIQIWYLVRFNLHLTPIISLVFSLTSISLTILAKYTQKSILENSETVKVQFDIKIKDEGIEAQLCAKTNGIKKQFAAILEVTQNLIDIPKPKLIYQGFRFVIYLFVQDANVKHTEFGLIVNEAIHNGALVNVFQTEWHLESDLQIDNVKSEKIVNKSKQAEVALMDSNTLTT